MIPKWLSHGWIMSSCCSANKIHNRGVGVYNIKKTVVDKRWRFMWVLSIHSLSYNATKKNPLIHTLQLPFCSLRWYQCSLKWTTRLSTFPTSYLVDETFLDRITMTNRVYDNEMIIQKSNINQNWHRRDVGRLQSSSIKKSKKIPPETNLVLCNGKVT